jgi:hypothetical protein
MFPPEIRRVMARLPLFTAIFLFEAYRGFAADLSFSGTLERVGRESLSIRLADRRVIDARLPNTSSLAGGPIAAQYKIGDQVRLTCKPIRPVWEASTSTYQSLELTKMLLVQRPSPEELAKMLEYPFREGENLLRGPAAAVSLPKLEGDTPHTNGDTLLGHAREVNLEHASKMPNFVADETAKRYIADRRSPDWRYVDAIESEITFTGNRAVRQQIRRNGKRWDDPWEKLPGFKWSGGFGAEIKPIFDSRCPTTIEYEGHSEARGRQLAEYRFQSPPDGCFVNFYFEYERYNPARTGHVFLDDSGGQVVRLEEEAVGFPAEFEFAQRKEQVSWDYIRIGDTSHLLPVGANFVVVYSSGTRWRVEVEYKNHRHFEASTDLTFH